MWFFVIGTALLFVVTYSVGVAMIPSIFPMLPKASSRKMPQWGSVMCLIVLSIVLSSFTFWMPASWWADRAQHVLGGGALVVFMTWLIIRDTRLPVTRLQFFLVSILVASTLGVAYELLEFLGEMTTSYVFQTSQYDTWLDLLSNSVGAVVMASIVSIWAIHTRAIKADEGGAGSDKL